VSIPLSDRILANGHVADSDAAVPPATGLTAFSQRMADFYRRVDATVASHAPVCTNRGLCCKFATFGHRLYVTEPELRYFREGKSQDWRSPAADATDCPYHVGGVCTAREHRPLGCRIYFCDENAQDWQGPDYERFLAELKAIGGAFEMPYSYREWLSALREARPDETVDAPRPETLI